MAQRIRNENPDTPESTVPATYADTSALVLGAIEGEESASDIRLPRLQMAYGVGNLAEDFTPGDLVLGGDNLLAKRGEPVKLVILYVKQYWKEYLSNDQFQAGESPRTFDAEADVVSAGGTTQWINGVGPTFNRAMHLKMLIEKPADLVCGLFGLDIEDKVFAPAIMDVDKSAYRRMGPVVLTAAKFSLRTRGLISGMFSLQTKMEKINGNVVPVPVMKLVDHNSDTFIAQLKELFGVDSSNPL